MLMAAMNSDVDGLLPVVALLPLLTATGVINKLVGLSVTPAGSTSTIPPPASVQSNVMETVSAMMELMRKTVL